MLIKPNASSQASHSWNKCKKSLVSGNGCQASFHPLIESIHPSPLLLRKWRMTALYFHHSTLLEGLAHRICRLLWGLNTCSDPELKYLYSERENPRALPTPTSWKILSIGHDVSQPAVGKKTARDMWILQRLRCDGEIHQISRQKQFHSQSQHRLVEMWTPFSSKQNHALPELSLRVWFWVRTTTAHLALPCKVVLTRLWSLLPGGCPPPTSLPWIA